jgi:poly(A) polymerase
MAEHGLLTPILGGVAEFGRFARAAASGGDPVRRLAALAIMVREDADRLSDRLRLSNEEHERLGSYAAVVAVLKDREDPLDAREIRRLVAEYGPARLAAALAAVAGEPRPVPGPGAAAALEAFVSGQEAVPVLPLRGADFVAAGVPKGPQVGALLARARALWIAEGCPVDAEAAADLLRRALAEGAGESEPTRH